MDELKEGKVDCLKKTAAVDTKADTFMINEQAQCDKELFFYMGGLLAFSFLCRQPFSLDFADPVWKQIIGEKLSLKDVVHVDRDKYLELSNIVDEREQTKAVAQYFSKFKANTDLIRKGMDEVLDGKLDVIAYLPFKDIKKRISGRKTYTWKDLERITKYKPQEDDKGKLPTDEELNKQKTMFWEIIESFDDEMRAKYLNFVWSRDRLPSNISGEVHTYMLCRETQTGNKKTKKAIKWAVDSIPTSHTCTFEFEAPYYSDKATFKRQLELAITSSAGVED